MDIIEFLDELFTLYPNSWNTDNKLSKMRHYKLVLRDLKLNYQKLLDVIAMEHKENFMPPPAWLREKSVKCLIEDDTSIWIFPIVQSKTLNLEKRDSFPHGTTEEQIRKTYEKIVTPSVSDWEIIGYVQNI